jgi:regulator of protease activity HflC (stomatin/prohibitin superfamily)
MIPLPLIIFLFVLILLIAYVIFHSVKAVHQSEVFIIERLGKFHKVADAGLTVIIPFIDQVRYKISLKQQTLDVQPQEVITKDNVTISINTVVFYKIVDPAKAVYEIQSLKKSIEYLSITTTRDIVGKLDLDSTFSSRELINDQLRAVLNEATTGWGCLIERVEVQDITPPEDIRTAMEKQMNAERNKRAEILRAEGERQAKILQAEGEKEAAILAAEAEKEAKIRKAAGDAEAIKKVAEAKALEVQMVYSAMKKAAPDEKVIQLKSLEALKDIADGDANKIFIPFESAASNIVDFGIRGEMLHPTPTKKSAHKIKELKEAKDSDEDAKNE